jgi:hypothetical protein
MRGVTKEGKNRRINLTEDRATDWRNIVKDYLNELRPALDSILLFIRLPKSINVVKSKAIRILLLLTTKLFLVLLKYLFLNAQQQNAITLSQHVLSLHAAEALVEN